MAEGIVGHDLFLNMASPNWTSEKPHGVVWWALRLNDMDADCAMTVAMLYAECCRAGQEADHLDYTLEHLRKGPRREVKNAVPLRYEAVPAAEVALSIFQATVRQETVRTRYDYLKELLEAAYVS